MAQFTNITKPSNTFVTTNNFTKNGSYYYGTLALTASSGYKFDANANKYWKWNNASGRIFKTGTLSLDDTKLTFSVQTSDHVMDSDLGAAVYIDAVAIVQSVARELTVTQNLQNCTISGLPSTVTDATALNLTLTAANGYQFDTAPQLVFDQTILDENGDPITTENFTVSNDKLTATLSIDLAQCNLDYLQQCNTITINAAAAIPQTVTVTVTVNAQNCAVNGVPQTVYPDTVLTLIANANSGYKFDTETPPQVYILDANGNPHTVNFTLSENDTVAQCTVNLGGYTMDNTASVTITANAAAITPYVEKYGTINVYKVTTQNLTDFAAVRFKKEKDTPSDTSGYFQLIDLGDYVVSVKRFYCLISDVLTAYIKAGNYNTNIQCETPQNDNFIIDCGTVAIPMQNNSITDYQNSEIKIFLPFVGFVSLPSDYVGKTIALQYRVNIVNGDCLAVLSCNGIEIDFVQCTISNDVIFKTNKENNFSGNAEFNLQVLKGLQPYAVIKTVTDKNAQIFNADCLRVALSEISGYFAANEIENFVSDTITETEKEILFNEIANGVFILAV